MVTFEPDARWNEAKGVYEFTADNSINNWFSEIHHNAIEEYERVYYEGAVSNLYYAFDSILSKGTTEVRVVTDKSRLYYYDRGVIDTVKYKAYIAPVVGGKGVIYQMIDEYNNNCPYDFKNMQFKHDGEWYYTFSYGGADASIGRFCSDNYLAPLVERNNQNTPVTAHIPKLIFNLSGNVSVGIVNNKINTPIRKGFIQARRITGNICDSNNGGTVSIIDEFYIYCVNFLYGNRIMRCIKTFSVGSKDKPILGFYGNSFDLHLNQSGSLVIDCSNFADNSYKSTLDTNSSRKIIGGDISSCRFEDMGPNDNTGDVITFDSKLALSSCDIKFFNSLTINYNKTTASNSPLRFLNIDARGWAVSTITIPNEFPANSPYELKVAKNSKGEIKMWCDADLIQ